MLLKHFLSVYLHTQKNIFYSNLKVYTHSSIIHCSVNMPDIRIYRSNGFHTSQHIRLFISIQCQWVTELLEVRLAATWRISASKVQLSFSILCWQRPIMGKCLQYFHCLLWIVFFNVFMDSGSVCGLFCHNYCLFFILFFFNCIHTWYPTQSTV